MDREELQRRAGIITEREYGLGSDEAHADKIKRLVATADRAIDSGDTGQAKALLRDILRLVQKHEQSEMM